MKKTFKYRLQANPQVFQRAENWLALCRTLYNTALEQRISIYRQNKKSISCFAQMKQLSEFKATFPEYKKVGSQVLQDVLQRLDRAYSNFFRRLKNSEKPSFPRFKGRNRYNSFTLKQSGWKLEGKYLTITNLGRFKLRLSRPIEGDIKTITIHRTSTGKWFATFSCDNIPEKPLPKTGKVVGIDVGLESFLTTSDGIKIGNPRHFDNAHKKLTKKQQRLSRRVKDSKRRTKAKILVSKAHEKITNQRRDFHYKVARQLLNTYDTIYIEGMNFWNGVSHALTKEMRDTAWFGFFNILCFKAAEAGRKVIEVPTKGTSQLCSQCGVRVEKDLKIRVHSCPHCGLTIDRDLNAALNILRAGQALRASYTIA